MVQHHLLALKQDRITVSERNALVHLQAAVRSTGLNSTLVPDSQGTVS